MSDNENVLLYIKVKDNNNEEILRQEKVMRLFCKSNNYNVSQIFVDTDDSKDIMTKSLMSLFDTAKKNNISKIIIEDYAVISKKVVDMLNFNNIIVNKSCVLNVVNGKFSSNLQVKKDMWNIFNIIINYEKEQKYGYE